MVNESNAYAVVIADLKRRRDEIDATIAQLQAMADGKPMPVDTPTGTDQKEDRTTTANTPSGNPYLGMNIVAATKALLISERKPLSPSEIVSGLESGGLLLSGGNKANTIGSVLNRRQRKVGDIVSPKRGMWALKEWYPNRNFGKRGSDDTEGEREEPLIEGQTSVTSELEQPSAQTSIFPLRSND